ncbi:MAG: GTP-binding protein, partial [Actinobacteria bacterium]|nr:GTP-binding protein [Actinomycetota bacterium]
MNQVNVTDARKSVVIVGRPNVGKSTLFNRFVGEQAAIVEDKPGVTRDRHTREVEWCGHHFNVIDTGGWMPGGSALDSKVSRQVEAAAREADLVIFLVDATNGLVDDDESIAAWLRTTGRPILLVANKVDGPGA